MPVLLILCTCPDAATADMLACSLVERRLAACINVLSNVQSIFRWEGRIERAEETLMLVKTTAERFDAVRDHIVKAHPYALPEVLAFEAASGLDQYLDWVRAETMRPGVPT